MNSISIAARTTATGIATLALLAGTAFAQSDACTSVPPIGLGTTAFDTTGHTTSNHDGGGAPCFSSLDPGYPTQDGFWVFTAPSAGNFQFDTIGSGFDTILQVHAGNDCSATCITANVDFGGIASTSLVQIYAITAGTQILVQVGSYPGIPGQTGTLNIAQFTTPINDTCASPVPLVGVGTFVWNNRTATTSGFDGGVPCAPAGNNDAVTVDLFFSWTMPTTGAFRIDTLGSTTPGGLDVDTNLAVHSGSDCSATCIAQDSLVGNNSVLVPFAMAGDPILIQAGGWGGATNTLNLLNISLPPLPANNDCSNPTPIAGFGVWPFDTTNATTSGFWGGTGCPPPGNNDQVKQDVFYLWTATVGGAHQIDTFGSPLGFDTNIAIHTGTDCSAVCLAHENVGGADILQFGGVNIGDEYLVQVGGWATNAGPGILNIGALPPPPSNDTCATPIALAGLGTTLWDNTTALSSGFNGGGLGICPMPVADNAPRHDLFYSWSAPSSGDFVFDTVGSNADTVISLHAGSNCAATCLDYNDDIGSETFDIESRAFIVNASVGDPFLIQVATWSQELQIQTGILNIGEIALPTNDTCATPITISGEVEFVLSNEHPSLPTSNFSGGNPVNCLANVFAIDADLFYLWTPACDGDYVIHTRNSTGVIDTSLNVHLGVDCAATCLASNDDIDAQAFEYLSEVVLMGATAGTNYLVQVGSHSPGVGHGATTLTIENLGGPCPSQPINLVCDPNNVHSGGVSATLAASSFGSGVGSGLHLECHDGPALQFGFFLVSSNATLSIQVFSGILCLGAPQGRYSPTAASQSNAPALNSIGRFDASGRLEALSGNSTTPYGFDVPTRLPNPPGGFIDPGETWNFQLWFRDGFDANLSNVAEVTF